MADEKHRIYRITSIGRPVDPAFPTNRAVLWLLPVAALVAGLAAYLGGAAAGASVSAALRGSAVLFGAWALGRELAPDDNPAAFVAVALAFGLFLVLPPPDLLLLFTTLLLVRIVNRSVGPPAKLTDAVAVTGMVALALHGGAHAAFAAVAALAFVLDALLPAPRRLHLAFATACWIDSSSLLRLLSMSKLTNSQCPSSVFSRPRSTPSDQA